MAHMFANTEHRDMKLTMLSSGETGGSVATALVALTLTYVKTVSIADRENGHCRSVSGQTPMISVPFFQAL